jgi:hypothetical protein
MNFKPAWKLMLIAAAVLAATSVSVFAGPPLICHRLDIGSAKSLPWGANPVNWDQPLENYDLSHLADETLASLSPGTPVIFHMETIRRAVIYSRRSPEVSKELILKMSARAHDAESQSKPDALAMFDFGYLIEATKEAGWGYHGGDSSGRPNVAMNLDGYSWVTKALASSHDNPEIEFALALITMGRSDLKSHGEYARAALAGASADSLLARNLTGYFIGERGDTMVALLKKEAGNN